MIETKDISVIVPVKNESGNIEKQFEHTRESLNAMMHFVKERYNLCHSPVET